MAVGTVHNKDKFLNNIAKSLGRERKAEGVILPEWKNRPQYEVFKGLSQDQLVDQLEDQCQRIHTVAKRATLQTLTNVLKEAISELGGKSIVNWKDPRFEEYNLIDTFAEFANDEGKEYHVWDPTLGEENVEIAERANIGITFSDITLAESGSVVLFSDKGKGRSVSLLPATYIAIIPKSTIVPRMTQATKKIHEMAQESRLPSCINFISGPSNSADIELNLVVGVHGPIKATYIIVEDK
ncbi:lactate utilization protein C [Anaerobacillus alkalilacustris]|uniref:Lactate utilization protein C n=1 Tax=Anaerobacillus alkalilacustris TaxID=393763 RepID=A0A1S2LYV3_9BACI|nr:lactate utilization protein C [Anaerobacillus alkalilacustris]OIJ16605.1 lactate utilization protein C [Anaerobacillus alkalilacustris]